MKVRPSLPPLTAVTFAPAVNTKAPVNSAGSATGEPKAPPGGRTCEMPAAPPGVAPVPAAAL
jgi:hypothetical protein